MGDDDKKKEEKKKEEGEDERLEYILNYLVKSMRMKMDKWTKMISTDEYKVSSVFVHFFLGNSSISSFFLFFFS